jgi:Concanavalin A-like lectin/glucanases superfamily
VNGAQVASKPLTGPITTGTNALRIGSWNGSSDFFAGGIDEPAVFPSALTPSQISDHYLAGIGGLRRALR